MHDCRSDTWSEAAGAMVVVGAAAAAFWADSDDPMPCSFAAAASSSAGIAVRNDICCSYCVYRRPIRWIGPCALAYGTLCVAVNVVIPGSTVRVESRTVTAVYGFLTEARAVLTGSCRATSRRHLIHIRDILLCARRADPT